MAQASSRPHTDLETTQSAQVSNRQRRMVEISAQERWFSALGAGRPQFESGHRD